MLRKLAVLAMTAMVPVGLAAATSPAIAGATLLASSGGPAGSSSPKTGTATTITLVSGKVKDTLGQDPYTSYCPFPSNGTPTGGFTSVTVDSYYPSPTCPTGSPVNPYVISAAHASNNSWGAAIAGSRWVGPNKTGSSDAPDAGGFIYPPGTTPPLCPAGNVPTGFQTCNFYLYDATFTMKCPTKPKLKGEMMSDNLAGVFLNGNYITEQATGPGFSYDGVNPPASNFTTPTPFVAPAADFVAGVNTVDFVVWDSTVPATGLDYKMVVTCK